MTGSTTEGDVGASLVEDAVLIALVSLVGLVSLRYFGSSRDNSFSRSASRVAGLVLVSPF